MDSCWRGQAQGRTWAPLVEMSILYQGSESRRMDAVVDSGAQVTIFEATIGERLGINVRDCPSDRLQVATRKDESPIYFHEVTLRVARASVRIMAGFCYELTVPALLGRHGFFDNFRVTFDPTRMGMQIDRVERE